MPSLVPDEKHPALEYPEPERVDYLTVAASMAFADAEVEESELERLGSLCDGLEMGPESKESVLAAAREPGAVDVDAILDRLRESELRFALMVDVVDIAFADGKLEAAEGAELDRIAERLDIDGSQLGMIRRFVADRRGVDDEPGRDDDSAGLVGVGVPAAALALAAAVGAPLAAAAGIAASLGIGSYLSVKWLAKRARGKSS